MMSNIKGIYPCGEGAGYAGGIMSAAVDGINVAINIMGKQHHRLWKNNIISIDKAQKKQYTFKVRKVLFVYFKI